MKNFPFFFKRWMKFKSLLELQIWSKSLQFWHMINLWNFRFLIDRIHFVYIIYLSLYFLSIMWCAWISLWCEGFLKKIHGNYTETNTSDGHAPFPLFLGPLLEDGKGVKGPIFFASPIHGRAPSVSQHTARHRKILILKF